MLLGDVEGRASLLEKAGQQGLANLTRKVHHIEQEDLTEEKMILNEQNGSCPAQLLQPPPPLIAANCPWPSSRDIQGLKSGEIVKEGYRDLAVGLS